MHFRKLPHWAESALITAVGTASVRRGIARAVSEQGVLLLQFVYRSQRQMAVVVQHPLRDIQDAYDKANSEIEAGEIVCYFVIATAQAIARAESAGVSYMRIFSGVAGGGAVLRVPYAVQFSREEQPDA